MIKNTYVHKHTHVHTFIHFHFSKRLAKEADTKTFTKEQSKKHISSSPDGPRSEHHLFMNDDAMITQDIMREFQRKEHLRFFSC